MRSASLVRRHPQGPSCFLLLHPERIRGPALYDTAAPELNDILRQYGSLRCFAALAIQQNIRKSPPCALRCKYLIQHGLLRCFAAPAILRIFGIRWPALQAATSSCSCGSLKNKKSGSCKHGPNFLFLVTLLYQMASWKVRLITSACCSGVSLMKFTA